MGFGLGDDYPEGDLACFGELTDLAARARALDEGLKVFSGLVHGDVVDVDGEFVTARDVAYRPTALRPTGIPTWTAGRWPHLGPIRRAARHDGMMVIQISEPAQVEELRVRLGEAGADVDHFDIAVWGQRDERLVYRADERYEEWARAGVTWFLTGPGPFNLDVAVVRDYVSAGPPRY